MTKEHLLDYEISLRRCPKCLDVGLHRNGVHFENDLRCGKCQVSWDPHYIDQIRRENPILKHVQQPEGNSLCGQSCVAILCNIDLESAISAVGTKGATRHKQLANVFDQYGWTAENKLTRFTKNTKIPKTCLIKVHWATKGRTHWVLKHNFWLHDPLLPKPVFWSEKYLKPNRAVSQDRMTSYLELK